MIRVYGVDHSPWVQTVLLGFYHIGQPHQLQSVPPLRVFLRSGVMMPAASFDGGDWVLESSDILEQAGYPPISDEDRQAIQAAWRGVLHRPDRTSTFFRRFAEAGDTSESILTRTRNNLLRSFMTCYFYVLIRTMVWRYGHRDPDNFGDQFVYWEEKLARSGGPFLDGEEAGINDMMLFGVLQCHCSIPVPPLSAIASDPRLNRVRAWISHMQRVFSDYPHLYSGRFFKPLIADRMPASGRQQAAFWVGTGLCLMLLPVTLLAIIWLAARVDRS